MHLGIVKLTIAYGDRYDHFHPEVDGDNADPYTSNFAVHMGGNLLAELDLQESATAKILSIDGQTPMPLLVSEYGGGFDGHPQYSPAHDWWVLRTVIAKLMHFIDRPDRILKALPFITGKAIWSPASRANNASHSYPFALWRTLTRPGGDPENKNHRIYALTHLHKFL